MDAVVDVIRRRLSVVRFLPTGAAALVIAELFYKFHSFTLECVAFLATWFVLDVVLEAAVATVGARSRT